MACRETKRRPKLDSSSLLDRNIVHFIVAEDTNGTTMVLLKIVLHLDLLHLTTLPVPWKIVFSMD